MLITHRSADIGHRQPERKDDGRQEEVGEPLSIGGWPGDVQRLGGGLLLQKIRLLNRVSNPKTPQTLTMLTSRETFPLP